MRNRWGIEIRKGYHAWYRGGRNGTEEGEGKILNVDTKSDYAKAYGPVVYVNDDAGPIHVCADAIYQVLPPMKLARGGVVKANPTPNLDRYDQPSQREHVTPRGKRSKAPTERLKQRRLKTHHNKVPGVWANPLVRVKVKSPAQRGGGDPSPRLVARRKTAQKAPEGFYANPASRRSLFIVWQVARDGIKHQQLAMFEKKSLAVEYGKAYAIAHGVSVAVETKKL